MVSFKLNPDAKISEEEMQMLENAKKLPVIYDKDSPELSSAMEEAFIEARNKKPYRVEPLRNCPW